MKRWSLPLALVVIVAAVAVILLFYSDRGERPDTSRLPGLRTQHQLLQERLARALEGVPLLARSEVNGGDVVVAIRTSYLADVIREVSRRYLDRVTLDLGDIHAHAKGELKKDTLLGKIKLGDWSVRLNIARLQGTLGGHTPELEIAAGNMVKVGMPVTVQAGRGQGELKFSWSAASLVNVVCHDFEVNEKLEALVIPAQYYLRGSFSIAAEGEKIVARPVFQRDKYRIRIDLTPESWVKIRSALDAQDTVGRCGLAMDPDQVMLRLRALAQKGFDIRLPASLFRTVNLPAGLHSKVEVQGTGIELDIQSRLLRLTPEILWYGASISGHLENPGALALPGASKGPTARPTS